MGLSVEQAASVLGVSAETVKRDWRLAKAWLKRELEPSDSSRQPFVAGVIGGAARGQGRPMPATIF